MKVTLKVLSSALFVLCVPAEAQIQTADLEKACKEKTKVVEFVKGKAEVVGEQTDNLCRGYLEGTLDALRGVKLPIVCLSGSRPTSEYLTSVFLTYVGANPAKRTEPATKVVRESFERAFQCKDADIDPMGLFTPEENAKRRAQKTKKP